MGRVALYPEFRFSSDLRILLVGAGIVTLPVVKFFGMRVKRILLALARGRR
jgi:hypothetical protein